MSELKIRKVVQAEAPMNLLLEADPSEAAIQRYLPYSDCYVAELEGELLGVFVLMRETISSMELKNIAVAPAHQGAGWGRKLLEAAIEIARAASVARLELGTGTFGYQLAFYQKAGFRVTGVDKDFFLKHYDAPIFENGLQHKDMLRLSLEF